MGERQSLHFHMMVTQFDRHVLVWGNGAESAKYVRGSKQPIFFLENTPPLYSLGHNEDTHSGCFCLESETKARG